MPNHILNDPKLSFKAKGLWAYINSKDNGWSFSVEKISKQTKEKEDSVRSGLTELREAGLLTYKPNRDKKGHVNGWIYCLYAHPQKPNDGKTVLGKNRTTEKGGYISKKEYSKKESSKKEEEEEKKEEEKEEKLQPTFSIKKVKTLEDEIKEYLENKILILAECPQLRNIVEAIQSKAKENYKEYIDFVYSKKLNDGVKLFDQRAWNIWYFNDFYAQKKVVQTSQSNSMPSANVAYAWQLEMIAEYNEKVKNNQI
jgi:hypothetical protein